MDRDSTVVDHCRYLMGHTNVVSCVQFFPSGDYLVSSSFDNFIKVWEVSTGRCVRTLRGHSSAVKCLALSMASPVLVSGSYDRTLKVWDVKTSEVLATYAFHDDKIQAAAIVEGGQRVVAAGDDKALKGVDLTTGQLVLNMTDHTNSVKSLSWSESRNLLVSASADNTVKVWDLTSQQCIKTFIGHRNWINSVAWGEGDDFLASGSGDHTVKIWSMTAGALCHTIEGHDRFVSAVEWAPEKGLLLTGSYDSTIKLWKAGTWGLANTFDAHTSEVTCIKWNSHRQQFVSSSSDRSIKVWDTVCPTPSRQIEGGRQTCGPITWLNDTKLAVALRGSQLGIFDVSTGKFEQVYTRHTDNITCLAYHQATGCLAVGCGDGVGLFLEVVEFNIVTKRTLHTKCILALSFNAEGDMLASLGQDNKVKILNLSTSLDKSYSYTCEVSSLIWVESSLVVLAKGVIEILNLDLVSVRSTQADNIDFVSVEYCPSIRKLAVGDRSGTLQLINYDSLSEAMVLHGHTNYIGSLIWVESENCLVSGSDDKTVRLWDCSTGACIFVYEGHNFPVRGMAYQAKKSLLAVSLELLTLWELSWSKLKGFLWVVRSWKLPKMLMREVARFI